MTYLMATMHTLGLRFTGWMEDQRSRLDAEARDREAGIATIEIVFWAAAVILLCGLVYAAIMAYVNKKLPGIS